MALNPCGECGREISSTAPRCPHCGWKRPRQKLSDDWIRAIAMTVAAIVLAFGIWLVQRPSKEEHEWKAYNECQMDNLLAQRAGAAQQPCYLPGSAP